MRQGSDGRGSMPPRGDASDAGNVESGGQGAQPASVSSSYAVGDKVFGAIDGCPGRVTSVSDVVAPLVCVRWDGEKDDVIYPVDTVMIRKAWPWE